MKASCQFSDCRYICDCDTKYDDLGLLVLSTAAIYRLLPSYGYICVILLARSCQSPQRMNFATKHIILPQPSFPAPNAKPMDSLFRSIEPHKAPSTLTELMIIPTP